MRRYLYFSYVLVVMLSLTACHRVTFNGSRTGNDSQLIMEYSIFNGTDSQSLVLEEGDVIYADIVSDSGKLSVSIQKDGEEPIYEGKGIPSCIFQVEVKESGTYVITVTGKKAKGSVSFKKNND